MLKLPGSYKQKGVSFVVLILAGGISVLLIAGMVFFIFNSIGKKGPANQEDTEQSPNSNTTSSLKQKKNIEKCESLDYTGCDEDPNFYNWSDDGKRK